MVFGHDVGDFVVVDVKRRFVDVEIVSFDAAT